MTELNRDVLDYLETKRLVWKPESVKATASRLSQWSPRQDAEAVYERMVKSGYSPYYIKITFISLASLTDWLIAQGRASYNNYRRFLQDNNQVFRNAYEDKYATISWEEFEEELKEAEGEMRTVLALLGYGGCRLSEVYTFDGRTVLGKGGKRRMVHTPCGDLAAIVNLSPDQIRRRLKHNPHSYRKLAADKWLRNGIDIKTVQKLLGHTSLASTQRYLRPMEDDALKNRLEEVWRTA